MGIFKPNAQNINLLKHVYAYYRNYSTDCNQILHSDKDHRMLFVGGPRHLKKNGKLAVF